MIEKAISVSDMGQMSALFGDFDENINIIQREYKVSIYSRDDEIRIKGDENAVQKASEVISLLIDMLGKGEILTDQSIRYAISMANEGKGEELEQLSKSCICVSHTGKPIKPNSDKEIVPFTYEGGIEAFIENEVKPYASDAFIKPGAEKVGYELSFTKYFYKPVQLRTLEEIAADIRAIEKETDGLLDEILGG